MDQEWVLSQRTQALSSRGNLCQSTAAIARRHLPLETKLYVGQGESAPTVFA